MYIKRSSRVGWINEITTHSPPMEIHIRVIKKWIWHNKKEDLSYIFVDSHGDAIEAIANSEHEAYFDSLIKIQSCYDVSRFVSTEARRQMRVVPHDACIKFGKMAAFVPIDDNAIPTFYYNFATYDSLAARIYNPRNTGPNAEIKPLTDYIGCIKHITGELPRKSKRLRKVTIIDTSENELEITFWEEKRNAITDQNAIGSIIAVSSTLVTYYHDYQLESTSATTACINPPIPGLDYYINRFKQIGEGTTKLRMEPPITLAQMLQKNNNNNSQSKGTSNITVRKIDHDKAWYKVTCNNCNNIAHRMQSDKFKFVCLDHWDEYGVKFITVIADKDTTAKAVFYDEAMTDILEMTCEEMIMKKGYKDPTTIPDDILAIEGQHYQLQMTLRRDAAVNVNRAKKLSSIIPNTPTAKPTAPKRPYDDSPDIEQVKKKPNV